VKSVIVPVAFAALLVSAPLVAAAEDIVNSVRDIVLPQKYHSAHYLVGHGVAGMSGGCTAAVTPAAFSLGGTCDLLIQDLTRARVTVDDEFQEHVGFFWVTSGSGDCNGLSGTATDTVSFDVPTGCTWVSVFLDAGALRGTITTDAS